MGGPSVLQKESSAMLTRHARCSLWYHLAAELMKLAHRQVTSEYILFYLFILTKTTTHLPLHRQKKRSLPQLRPLAATLLRYNQLVQLLRILKDQVNPLSQGAKPLSPTLSWSAGLPDVEGTRKTAPGIRRAGDKVAVKSTNTGPGNSIEKDSAQRHRVQAKEQKQAVDTQRYDCNMSKGPSLAGGDGLHSRGNGNTLLLQNAPVFNKAVRSQSVPAGARSSPYSQVGTQGEEAGANEGVLSKSALLSGEVEPVLAIGADQLMAPAAQSVVLPKVLTKIKLAPAKGRSTSDRKRSSGNRTFFVSAAARSVSPAISKLQSGGAPLKSQKYLSMRAKSSSGPPRNRSIWQSLHVDVHKPVEVPVPRDADMSPRDLPQVNVDKDIVDLVEQLNKEEAEKEISMKADISDAIHKWCGNLPPTQQKRVAHIALKFLRRMSSTVCFLVAAYRMLAKAPWTLNMVATDVKQAALVAISKGWYLKSVAFKDFPFSKSELAVAAATYLEQIPAGTPEDPFYALGIITDFLPLVCGSLFSQATLTCPHCSANCTAPVPCIILNVTWTMDSWSDFVTAIANADLLSRVQQYGWHYENCNRSDAHTVMSSRWTFIKTASK